MRVLVAKQAAEFVRRLPPQSRRRLGRALGAFYGDRFIYTEEASGNLVGLVGAHGFVWGVLDVLMVVVAIEVLHLGQPGVGFLNSALGLGALNAAPNPSGSVNQYGALRRGEAPPPDLRLARSLANGRLDLLFKERGEEQ